MVTLSKILDRIDGAFSQGDFYLSFLKGPLTWFDDSSKIWKLIGVVSYGSRKAETKIESKTST